MTDQDAGSSRSIRLQLAVGIALGAKCGVGAILQVAGFVSGIGISQCQLSIETETDALEVEPPQDLPLEAGRRSNFVLHVRAVKPTRGPVEAHVVAVSGPLRHSAFFTVEVIGQQPN